MNPLDAGADYICLTDMDADYIYVAYLLLRALDDLNPTELRTCEALADILRRAGWEL